MENIKRVKLNFYRWKLQCLKWNVYQIRPIGRVNNAEEKISKCEDISIETVQDETENKNLMSRASLSFGLQQVA